MVEILTEKNTGSKILDALAIAGVVLGSSVVLSPIVSNNNLLSGAVKVGAGLLASGVGKGKVSEILGAGFLIDGATDLINMFFSGSFKGFKVEGSDTQGAVFI